MASPRRQAERLAIDAREQLGFVTTAARYTGFPDQDAWLTVMRHAETARKMADELWALAWAESQAAAR